MTLRGIKPEDIKVRYPVDEYFVDWDSLKRKQVNEFEKCLENAQREEDIQSFLAKNPIFLVQHLCGGHGRWVIPKQKLGAEHVTDFILGQKSSIGYEWYAVELESPNAKMFTKSGNPSAALIHAIRQIQDWRAWLQRNQDYASREKNKKGLGLIDITSNVKGIILMGRRKDIEEKTNELRRQMGHESQIEIHSMDFLLETARERLPFATRVLKTF